MTEGWRREGGTLVTIKVLVGSGWGWDAVCGMVVVVVVVVVVGDDERRLCSGASTIEGWEWGRGEEGRGKRRGRGWMERGGGRRTVSEAEETPRNQSAIRRETVGCHSCQHDYYTQVPYWVRVQRRYERTYPLPSKMEP